MCEDKYEFYIKGFRGCHAFLSNFYECKVVIDGVTYPNSENAFQAMKCANKEDRLRFVNIDAKTAKALGKRIKLRSDWENVKLDIMYDIVKYKFSHNELLRAKLLATESCYLEETNYWGDTFWGVCNGVGENYLGKILMKVRKELS